MRIRRSSGDSQRRQRDAVRFQWCGPPRQGDHTFTHADRRRGARRGDGRRADARRDGAGAGRTAAEGRRARSVDINLVTVNDFHGRIEQAGTAAGIARLSTAVDSFRAANPNTVFAAAGDLIGASTFTSFIQQDDPTIDALNAAGLDVSAVGNHEFDKGFADLTDRVMPSADWEYLGANVYHKDTTDPALPEYWTAKFQGVTIGFVGAVTDELPSLVSPAGIEDISVGSPVEAANRVADQLSDGKQNNGEADIVIMLVHEGAADTTLASATDPNSPFGEIVLNANDNIDAIVSGHTHLPYNHVIDGRPVISSGQYGERFSNMEISYDRATEHDHQDGEHPLHDGHGVRCRRQRDGVAVRARSRDRPDRDRSHRRVANELGNVVIGQTSAAFNRAQRPGVVNGLPAPGREPRRRVDARQLRRRRAALVAERGRPGPRRADHVHEPGRPARRHQCRATRRIARRRTCSRSRTRS